MSDRAELQAVARLLGVLLQREPTPELARTLATDPTVVAALVELDLALPAASDTEAYDALAVEYFEALLAPSEGPPPIQSVAKGGGYEGDAAVAVRRIVEHLGLTRDRVASRGAPADHLGSELELWAEISARAPEHADSFALHHLAWALPLMRFRARREGHVARLCHATAEFLTLVCPTPTNSPDS